jgi:hypothetical protein
VTIVAVVGDATTTTAVAIAAGWPIEIGAVVIEADPRGGSLAGWLDTPADPSLATIVATVGIDATRDQRAVVDTVEAMTHRSASGIRFVANAVRARAAHRSVEEASFAVFPALVAAPSIMIADVGLHDAGRPPSPALRVADVVVITHRQAHASAGAASVRVERLVELVEDLARLDTPLVLAVIGDTPFDPDEVAAFVDHAVPDTITATATLADDALSAASIAGRRGVSAKRLRRLPLMRDASVLAARLDAIVAAHRTDADARTNSEAAST